MGMMMISGSCRGLAVDGGGVPVENAPPHPTKRSTPTMTDPDPPDLPVDPPTVFPPDAGTAADAPAPAAVPKLWNPNAAGLWSFVFSPVFGSLLHAANWRALGEPGRARVNVAWCVGTLLLILAAGGSAFLVDESAALDNTFRILGLLVLIGWYATQGRSQIAYVKERYGEGYPRRGWALPLVSGFGVVITVLVVVVAIDFATYQPSAEDVAQEMRPRILAELRKQPGDEPASIQDITLEHMYGDTYMGSVEATLDGRRVRLPLTVNFGWSSMSWQLGVPVELAD